LAANLDALTRQPQAGQALDEIGDAVGRAYRAIDRPAARLLAGMCNTPVGFAVCHAMLYAKPGDLETKCVNCGALHNVPERRMWMVNAAAELQVTHGVAMGWVVLLMAKRIPAPTWRSWVHRGRVTPVGMRDGRPLYRFGDIRDLAMSHAAREPRRKAETSRN
jgi:hypothetical protein